MTARLLTWGEQGLGDELMFATVLYDAKHDYQVIYDHHPRLSWLFEHSRWMNSPGHPITLFPTRKKADKGWSVEAQAKCAIGNLARFYRRKSDDFPWAGPWYSAPEKERAEYRSYLESIAQGRKIVGLATRGGTMHTSRLYRLLPLEVIERLFSDERYLFVSLDYEDMTPLAEHVVQKFGTGRYVWHPSIVWHFDYEHTAALVAATDAVVTITQTVAHLSAAMGHPTYILTPSRPDWRMGLKGETWVWYPHQDARLLRQLGDSWTPAVDELMKSLEARFFKQEAA